MYKYAISAKSIGLHFDIRQFVIGVIALFILVACSDDKPAVGPSQVEYESGTQHQAPWLQLSTQNGLYSIDVLENYSLVPAGTLHSWDFHLSDASGNTVDPNDVLLSATMPGHGHGMTNFPQPMTSEREGVVRVNGMKFHMGGEWQLRLALSGPAGSDQVTFDIVVAPPKAKTQQPIEQFDDNQLALLKTLHINELTQYTGDPSNRYSRNADAIALGAKLFSDTGLSANNDISCASCHQPSKYFTDGKKLSRGIADTLRHAPGLIGAAWHRWFYWDGRRDSLWAQALTPLETKGEMGSTRVDAVRYVMTHQEYGDAFRMLSGANDELLSILQENINAGPFSSAEGRAKWHKLGLPTQDRINRSFADVGKIIAAYEETLIPAPSKLDKFIDALETRDEAVANSLLSESERRGAGLFVDVKRTECTRCHNGALFTNREFHNVATGIGNNDSFDFGRMLGLQAVLIDPFNCRGKYSDAPPGDCQILQTVRPGHLDSGAFKTPSLRHVSSTAPYMHDGRFSTLEEVMDHYMKPIDKLPVAHEMPQLELTNEEVADLIAFLKIL